MFRQGTPARRTQTEGLAGHVTKTANAVRTQIRLDGWSQLADDSDLVAMMIKDRSGGALSEVKEMQLQAYWTGYLVRTELTL